MAWGAGGDGRGRDVGVHERVAGGGWRVAVVVVAVRRRAAFGLLVAASLVLHACVRTP